MIHANLNETPPIFPGGSNCTQVWVKLFNYPNLIESIEISPNVSNSMQI